jgi:hypothetical protein
MLPDELLSIMIALLDCSNGSLLLHDENIHHRVTKLRTTTGSRHRQSSMDTTTATTVRRQRLIQSLLTLLSKLRTFMSATSPEGDTPAADSVLLLEIEQCMRQIRVDAHLFQTETIPQERQTIISIQQQFWQQEYCDAATTATTTTTSMTTNHSWYILIQSFVSNFLVQLQWEEQLIIRTLYPTLDSIYHHCGDTTMTSSSIHDNTNPTSTNNNISSSSTHAGDSILQIIHGLRRTTFRQQHQFRRGIEILQTNTGR